VQNKTKVGGNNDIDDGEEDNPVIGDGNGNHKNFSKVAINIAAIDDATQSQKMEKTTTMPMMLHHNIAINFCLIGLWICKYQVLEGRTHPNMKMKQNGGYLLTGIKLCPGTGTNKLDKEKLHEMRARLGGRRKQLTCHMQKKNNKAGEGGRGRPLKRGRREM
jgi:hypothetical protein